MKKYLSLIIIPHDASRPRNYKISYPLLLTFIGIVAVAVIAVGVLVATYGKVLVKAKQAADLTREKQELMERNAQIDSLRTELVKLQTMGIQVKKMMGLNLSTEDSILVANLSPIVNSPAMSESDEGLEVSRIEQQEMLRAIPSLWPLKGYVTREFYTTGGEKSAQYHPGMDIAASRNTPVRTSAEGVVVSSGWDDTYGYRVVIDHGFGIYTLYGHNNRNLAKEGDRVARGQTIAFLGSTGKSTAPHLHFEVRKNGVAVNPRNFLLN